METKLKKTKIRCVIYTRKSSEEGLEQEFNSLDAQRLAGESYINSQEHEGWVCLPEHYDDGGYSGGNTERPALKKLLEDIKEEKIDLVIVYKIDRLSRSLVDFLKMIEIFEKYNVNFVSVTQSFNTANSMGRLMLNVLLSFAQYEREITAERISDKIRASKERGMWMGGFTVLGYKAIDKKLEIEPSEANIVRNIYESFIKNGSVIATARKMNKLGYITKVCKYKSDRVIGGKPFDKNTIRDILENPIYIGKVKYKDNLYDGQHLAIIDDDLWNKVQRTFNRKNKATNAEDRITMSPLLKDMIICGCCESKFTPVYTSKSTGDRQYRYYICNKKFRGGKEHCESERLPAGEIEVIVVKEVLKLLRSPEIITHTITAAKSALSESEITEKFRNVEMVWDELFPIEQARIVELLIERVIVHKEGLDIRIYRQGLGTLALELGESNGKDN